MYESAIISQLLLVDDSPVNLNLLTHHLRDKEYTCVTASSGVRAWELLEQQPDRFHAVVVDRHRRDARPERIEHLIAPRLGQRACDAARPIGLLHHHSPAAGATFDYFKAN